MSGIIDLFVPREKKFFIELEKQIEILDDCFRQLDFLSQKGKVNFKQLEKVLNKVIKKSDEADKINQGIINSLHQTFITPIDRDEIQNLSTNINRIIDSIEKIIAGVFYYKIEKNDKYFLAQLAILQKSIKELKSMFNKPLSAKGHRDSILTIRRQEKEGDRIFRKAIGYLFNNSHNPIDVIKLRELYTVTEDAIDDTKVVGDIFEMVLINNL